MPIRAAIFDLDGTLVDSGLDFDLMRAEMGLARGLPLLEAIAAVEAEIAARCHAILLEHERRGAQRATLYPGVAPFIDELAARGWRRAVFTRNSRDLTLHTLARVGLEFDAVLSRDDAPVKPDPAALLQICEAWRVPPSECVVIGDHRFDIEAGRRAGMHTVLYTGSGLRPDLREGDSPDYVLACFSQPRGFWRWVEQIDLEACGADC